MRWPSCVTHCVLSAVLAVAVCSLQTALCCRTCRPSTRWTRSWQRSRRPWHSSTSTAKRSVRAQRQHTHSTAQHSTAQRCPAAVCRSSSHRSARRVCVLPSPCQAISSSSCTAERSTERLWQRAVRAEVTCRGQQLDAVEVTGSWLYGRENCDAPIYALPTRRAEERILRKLQHPNRYKRTAAQSCCFYYDSVSTFCRPAVGGAPRRCSAVRRFVQHVSFELSDVRALLRARLRCHRRRC